MEDIIHFEKHGKAVCGTRISVDGLTTELNEVNCVECVEMGYGDKSAQYHLNTILETKGVRQNEGKPMLSPIDPKLLLEMGKGLAIGQEKYKDKAFNKSGNVMKLTTGYDSLMRHILYFMDGEDFDLDKFDEQGELVSKGDGVHHIAKAINCLVVMWHNREKGDDREKANQ